MCIVTLIPSEKNFAGFTLTSNRDESVSRHALAPKIYKEEGIRLLYPKDQESGGTWIGVSDRMRLVCLMNGAYKKHEREASYRKSRGLVVKDFLIAEDLLDAVENYSLAGIEPFTMILVSWKASLEIYEMIWNGSKTHFNKLPNCPHIWSAPMTYGEQERKEREKWFAAFLEKPENAECTAEKLWQLHHTGKAKKEVGFIIDRGKLKTTSITQFTHGKRKGKMRFENLLTRAEARETF